MLGDAACAISWCWNAYDWSQVHNFQVADCTHARQNLDLIRSPCMLWPVIPFTSMMINTGSLITTSRVLSESVVLQFYLPGAVASPDLYQNLLESDPQALLSDVLDRARKLGEKIKMTRRLVSCS